MPRTTKTGTAPSRALRRRMTEAEKRLWWHLERIPIEGSHFRRQSPIGPYIADFACHAARLIIEVDGSQHGTDEGARDDNLRTEWLSSRGYRVIRFWNHEVFNQIEVVLDTIYAALYTPPSGGAEADLLTPTPTPQGMGKRQH